MSEQDQGSSRDHAPSTCAATQPSADAGPPRRTISEGSWFAWRPVKTLSGGWVWLKTVKARRYWVRFGDYMFEGTDYALLP